MAKRSPEPISLTGKHKRLRSLNEFEPPYWLGLFRAKDKQPRVNPVVPVIGLAIGLALGVLLFL